MATAVFPPQARSRALAAVGAIVLQGLIGWALIAGLSGKLTKVLTEDIAVFDVAPPVPPPPPPVPVKVAVRRPSGAAAPPHARAVATPVVAPLPEIQLPPPPQLIVAAPVAALGLDAAAGAADAGPGSGAGGQGNGLGAGSGGNGTGAGGVRARLIHGRITDRDYPRAAHDAGIEGNLTTRYTIDVHGRIARCYIAESSGSEILDAATCRLAIERERYAPARDARGHPVEDTVFEDHGWIINHDGPEAGS